MTEEYFSVVPGTEEELHVCEGGNLDCGSGLLLIISKAMSAVPEWEILEIRSTEISVKEDLPSWCRMTKNPYLGWRPAENHNKYFVRRGSGGKKPDDDYQKAREYVWRTRVYLNGGMQAKVFCRNHAWAAGQPASFDLKDDAPSAVEYLLGALGSCLAMGFQIRASRRNVEIEQVEISLNGKIDNIFVFLGAETDGHSGFKAIAGEAYVKSDAAPEILEQLWQETLAASPVLNTLAHQADISIGMKAV